MHILKIRLRDQTIEVGAFYNNFGCVSRVKRIDKMNDEFSIHFEDRDIDDCELIPISSVVSYTKDYKKLEEITKQMIHDGVY